MRSDTAWGSKDRARPRWRYGGCLRNPNHQLIGGKHPMGFNHLVMQDFATIHYLTKEYVYSII